MQYSSSSLLWLAPLLVGCAGTAPPPANWAQGGVPLELPNARWTVGDELITIHPDGVVQRNGEFELAIDRAGRIYDEENDPVALLEPDGHLLGSSDVDLGRVGEVTAALPGSETAWLSVEPNGSVVQFGPLGEREPLGSWIGCNKNRQTAVACTLTTHYLVMKYQNMRRATEGFGLSVGVGVGIGVGMGAGSYGGASFSERPPFAPGPLP